MSDHYMLFYMALPAIVVCGVVGLIFYHMYQTQEEIKHDFQPSGVEATVTVLGNSGGECVFDYNGERLLTSTAGFFGAGHCKYLTGEAMTVWQANGGWWNIKEAVN